MDDVVPDEMFGLPPMRGTARDVSVAYVSRSGGHGEGGWRWRGMVRPIPDRPLPGQESVWDYPRPAITEPSDARIVVTLGGVTIVDTRRAIRTLETSHPPTYYVPPGDILPGVLRDAAGASFCEWKGRARYFDVAAGGEVRARAAWSYPDPTRDFAAIRDHVGFYAAAMDMCLVDGEVATPQPGGFYGGWITRHVAGPFKGAPGTRFW